MQSRKLEIAAQLEENEYERSTGVLEERRGSAGARTEKEGGHVLEEAHGDARGEVEEEHAVAEHAELDVRADVAEQLGAGVARAQAAGGDGARGAGA